MIFVVVYALLAIASLFPASPNVKARLKSWWVMVTLMGLCLWGGPVTIYAFFIAVSIQALREFNALTPLTLILTLAQYALVATGQPPALMLPILLIPSQRVPLLLAVHGLAYAPALPELTMVALILITQASDVLQYLWGKALGRRPIAPTISPHKTVEGTVGGLLSASALACIFLPPVQALAVPVAGFLGGLLLSKMKRLRGLKDWGQLIQGHGGILDRADSVLLSAPLLYYLNLVHFLPGHRLP